MVSRDLVLVVDPVSSGSFLAPRIKELYGIDSVAILSRYPIFKGLANTFRADDFIEVILPASLDELVSKVSKLVGGVPRYLLCGSELGVDLYELLSDHWGIPANLPVKTSARRDKHDMQLALQQSGLRYIPFFKTDSPDRAEEWCHTLSAESFVVKPINSFGTDSVIFCESPSVVGAAGRSILGQYNYIGYQNRNILVEAFIKGTEFVVDAVSVDGNHFIVDVFEYSKANVDGSPIYRTMSARDPSSYSELGEYVKAALNALGVRNGPSHSEVIVDEGGPVLVESGPRMHGGQGPKLVEIGFTHSLIDLTIQAALDANHFLSSTSVNSELVQGVTECFLASPKAGAVAEVRVDEVCRSLESFVYHTVDLSIGTRVEKTSSLFTSYGRVVLSHANHRVLESDTNSVMTADREGELLRLI